MMCTQATSSCPTHMTDCSNPCGQSFGCAMSATTVTPSLVNFTSLQPKHTRTCSTTKCVVHSFQANNSSVRPCYNHLFPHMMTCTAWCTLRHDSRAPARPKFIGIASEFITVVHWASSSKLPNSYQRKGIAAIL